MVVVHSRSGVVRIVTLADGSWEEISDLAGTCVRALSSGHLTFARQHRLFAVPFDYSLRKTIGQPVQLLGDLYVDALTGRGDTRCRRTVSLPIYRADSPTAAISFGMRTAKKSQVKD